MNLTMLRIQLKLLALKAVPHVEKLALEYLTKNGEKLLGAEKRQAAVEYIVTQYKLSTKNVPGLGDTEIDDGLVRTYAEKYLDWAWAQLESLINDTARTPVTNDATLPQGAAKAEQ